jgi:chromosome partitioning protein
MRNRINPTNLKSKRDIEALLQDLSARLNFQYIPGFSERIIFRDMFLKGLTLLDLKGAETGQGLSASELAARHEVRLLTHAIVPEALRLSLMRRKQQLKTAS